MLTKVEVLANEDNTLTLSLQDLSNGYVVKTIEGLDPVQATIVSSSFASIDGEQYQTSRRGKRNIVIKLDLKPEYSNSAIQDLRNQLYRVFMPKTYVRLQFYAEWMDMGFVEIYGRVESFESPLFVQNPDATISVLCLDPDFYMPEPFATTGNTTSGSTEMVVNYEGSVETGIRFIMNVNRSLQTFTINHRPEDGSVRVLTFNMPSGQPLLAGDVLEISTISGKKGATLLRGGVTTSILYAITPGSDWILLQPRPNYINVNTTGAAIPYVVEYTNKYGGL